MRAASTTAGLRPRPSSKPGSRSRRTEFDARLAAERQEWATSIGEELANRLLAAVKEFEGRVAETTARILKPFVAAELHRQAIAELQASLDALLATDSGVSLDISGPADVLEVLRQQLVGQDGRRDLYPER